MRCIGLFLLKGTRIHQGHGCKVQHPLELVSSMPIKGDRVRHPSKPDWGLGEVYDLSGSNKVHVYFEAAGRRCLSTNVIILVRVEKSDGKSDILDRLSDRTW